MCYGFTMSPAGHLSSCCLGLQLHLKSQNICLPLITENSKQLWLRFHTVFSSWNLYIAHMEASGSKIQCTSHQHAASGWRNGDWGVAHQCLQTASRENLVHRIQPASYTIHQSRQKGSGCRRHLLTFQKCSREGRIEDVKGCLGQEKGIFMIKEHKKGATDNVTKRTHERVSLGKNQGIFLSKREEK